MKPPNTVFRFETMRLSHLDFAHIVSTNCLDSLNLLDAIESFQLEVSDWNHNSFSNIFHQKKYLLACLTGIQVSMHYPTSIFLQNLEKELIYNYNNLLKLEEEF